MAVLAAPAARAADAEAGSPAAGGDASGATPLEPAAPPRAKIAGAPFVQYTPETRWGVGGGALVWFHADSAARATGRASAIGAGLQVTQRHQSAAFAQADLYLARAKWHATAIALAERWPYELWGLGDAANASSEPYTPRTARADLAVARLALDAGGGKGLWLGARAAWRSDRIADAAPGGLVDRCAVVGCGAGRVVAIQATAAWDTRDHVFAPQRGVLLSTRLGGAAPALGSAYQYRDAEFDARAYVPTGLVRGATLAMQGRLRATAGDVPFYLLPTFGGDRLLRGVLDGRYRDATSLVMQAEWSVPVAWRLGIELFGGAGQVAPRPRAIRPSRFVPAGGAGVRFVLDAADRVFVRADVGFTPGSSQWYLSIGQAI